MNIRDAIAEIKSRNKPYEHITPRMSQSAFSNMCARAEKGLLKNETLKSFMEKFGYETIIDINIIKIKKNG